MQETVWICSCCAEKDTMEATLEFRLIKRHVHDIVCTVKGDPLEYLDYASSLHKILHFNLETLNGKEKLTSVDLNINVEDKRKNSCHWYQKSTDTNIILIFRSCEPLHQKCNSGDCT